MTRHQERAAAELQAFDRDAKALIDAAKRLAERIDNPEASEWLIRDVTGAYQDHADHQRELLSMVCDAEGLWPDEFTEAAA